MGAILFPPVGFVGVESAAVSTGMVKTRNAAFRWQPCWVLVSRGQVCHRRDRCSGMYPSSAMAASGARR